jgi:hypothetical protein
MIDSEQRPEQTSVDLGVEDGDPYPIWGKPVGVGAELASDQTLASEATQVVGHLRRGVAGSEEASDLGTEAPIGEAGHRVERDTQGADQGHRARIPEAQGSGSLALLKRGQCDPFKERGRNGTALAGTLNSKQTTIRGASLGLQFWKVAQSTLAAQVRGRIADGLDTERSTFFEVLLDSRVFVEDVDDDVHAACDDLGRKRAVGVGSDLATEGQLHLVGATQVEVVGDECLEEAPGTPWCVDHQSARGFDLAYREFPPVASLMIGGIQRRGDDRYPAIEEGLEVIRPEPIPDRLQPGRIGARGEAVGQLGEGKSFSVCLPLGPLVADNPDFAGIGEVYAQLDEAESELRVAM